MKTRPFFLAIAAVTAATFLSFTPPTQFRKILKSYPFIPSGTIQFQDQTLSIRGFHLFEHEVTNLEYREFLAFLEREGRTEDLEVAKIHTSGWEEFPFRETYHSHPAYENYPVVNVSYEGALLYCQWLEDLYREKYGQKVHLRLPVHLEWVYAARAGNPGPYPWGGSYLRNEKGLLLANFRYIGPEQISLDPETGQYMVITGMPEPVLGPAPSVSYSPNGYGLFNTSGNVAEMLQEKGLAAGGSWASPGYDIRVESVSRYEGPSAQVGFRPVLVFE